MLIEEPERLIPLAVVAAFVLWWLAARASERRRFACFDELARAFGAEVVRESDRLLRFQTRVADREAGVRYQHLRTGWFLITELPLTNVLDVHSVDVRPRRRPSTRADLDEGSFDRHLAIDDLGYPLCKGWLNEPMRDALYAFYSMRFPVQKLVIEKATLIHRSSLPVRRFQAGTLLDLMTRQAEVARVFERTL